MSTSQLDTLDGVQQSDITIDGMTCAGCAGRVRDGLRDVEGVVDAHVNFATGRATVHHEGPPQLPAMEQAIESLGYHVIEATAAENANEERIQGLGRRLQVAGALTIPIMAISMIDPLRFEGWAWVVGALATVVVVWSGLPFHRAAVVNGRHGTATMDTLVSVGAGAAWLWSTVVLVADIDADVYFETGAVIVTLILLGKWLEARARRRSGDAVRALAGLAVSTATLEDGSEIAASELSVGDRFLVRPGDRIATDAIVVSGASAIDASMLTGESMPVDVAPGDELLGSTLNTSGSLVAEATRVGSASTLSQIVRMVEAAQGTRAPIQRLADRVASVFVPVAIAISLATLVGWFIAGEPARDAFTAAVAVLIVACPCALGLATPLAIMVGTGRAAQLGIIIKGGEVLEDTRTVDTVVLDKTGTITTGEMSVTDTLGDPAVAGSVGPLAASLEARSEHPIAAAIAATSSTRHDVSDFLNHPGLGVTGLVDGTEIAVGRAALFTDVAPDVRASAAEAEASGATTVFAGRDGTAEIAFVVADRIKPSASDAVAALHAQGMQTTLLTGDNSRTAEAVAAAVGITHVVAEVLPQDKAAEIERLQSAGQRVAMVGDGINDGPALAQADLGIAIGTGADVAIEASDLTLVGGDPATVSDAIAISRRTLATIKGNLFWAFAYNTAAIPLAAAGVLNPMIAAGAMGLSSLFVVSNSLRLRRFTGARR